MKIEKDVEKKNQNSLKEKKYRLCPSCGSTAVHRAAGGNMGEIYKCDNCSYQGIVFEGGAEFIKNYKEKLNKV